MGGLGGGDERGISICAWEGHIACAHAVLVVVDEGYHVMVVMVVEAMPLRMNRMSGGGGGLCDGIGNEIYVKNWALLVRRRGRSVIVSCIAAVVRTILCRPSLPKMPERNTSGFHRPDGHRTILEAP